MPALPVGLTREQVVIAFYQLNPLHAYRWLSDVEYEYRGIEQPDGSYSGADSPPSDANLQSAWAAYNAAQAQVTADEQTRRQAVVTAIQALAGVKWTDMTAAQKQTLIVALLYKAGAIDKTLTVQPVNQWL